ncbi:MAG: hypothetical protein AB1728_12360 [Bacteroidota bacterium]
MPPYEPPIIPFEGTIEVVYFGAPDSGFGATENLLSIYLTIKYPFGVFDETLQDRAILRADLEIVTNLRTGYRKDITLDDRDIVEIRSYKYNKFTKTLTMDPGDVITFFYGWDFKDNDGFFLPDIFTTQTDSTCSIADTIYTTDSSDFQIIMRYPRKISTQAFKIRGTAKLFSQFAAVQVPFDQYSITWENMTSRKCRGNPPK